MKLTKSFFLVSIACLLTFSSVEARHNKREKTKRPDELVANDRDIEMNRDFTNMLQYGLIDGMFKYKMSGSSDCTD